MNREIKEEIRKELNLLSNSILSRINSTTQSSSNPFEKLKEQAGKLRKFTESFNKEATPLVNSICKKHNIASDSSNKKVIDEIVTSSLEQTINSLFR